MKLEEMDNPLVAARWKEALKFVIVDRVMEAGFDPGFYFLDIDPEDARFWGIHHELVIDPQGRIGETNINPPPVFHPSFAALIATATVRTAVS